MKKLGITILSAGLIVSTVGIISYADTQGKDARYMEVNRTINSTNSSYKMDTIDTQNEYNGGDNQRENNIDGNMGQRYSSNDDFRHCHEYYNDGEFRNSNNMMSNYNGMMDNSNPMANNF